ncbi:MAG TPA: homocysteine S-methyltransferase family protein [Rhabdochlamydiaceae bacterium]|jgi:S-methylmethionine-dependent homocysteine/selenocysteine methylase|nr:homocysteine S-methyltransferase family protein [Rhabdochlamydiaceae bacterium]
MKILFGPYGCLLSSLGISSNPLTLKHEGQLQWYRIAVEMIARGYLNAGATLPTVNGFFLRPLLKENLDELFKEMLSLNIEALLTALDKKSLGRIAICLGPASHGYRPDLAPDTPEAYFFAKRQYELCLEVLYCFGLSKAEIVILHETIGTSREALGISQAAKALNIPLILSFIVDRAGNLLDGNTIESAISRIENETCIEGFSFNCCSPHAFDRAVASFEDQTLIERIIGFYPNSYDADPSAYETESLVEPQKTNSLQAIAEKGEQYDLQFIGGCCGFGIQDVKLLANLLTRASNR